jgi:hypothetical protein
LAVEDRGGKSGRAYAKVIDDFSRASIKPIFTDPIIQKAHVVTDGWSAYKTLIREYRNLTQIPLNKGKNFPMLHIQIRNFKNCLSGVHSYCDRKYLQNYIDAYFFRFNRRNHRETILDKRIARCVDQRKTKKSILPLSEGWEYFIASTCPDKGKPIMAELENKVLFRIPRISILQQDCLALLYQKPFAYFLTHSFRGMIVVTNQHTTIEWFLVLYFKFQL